MAHPVVFRGAVCADNGRFDRCEALWLHALDLRQNNNISVQRDLLRFAQLFSQMIFVDTVELRVGNVLQVLQSTIVELERNEDKMKNPGPKDDVELIREEYETNIFTGKKALGGTVLSSGLICTSSWARLELGSGSSKLE